MNIAITRPSILLMFSGGLDSLTCLYLLLKEEKYKDYEIHVHHIVLKNIEDRDRAETIAINNILNYLRSHNYRRFTYSESIYEYPSFNGNFIWDINLVYFIAATICQSTPLIKMAAFGVMGVEFNGLVRLKISKDIFSAFKIDAKILLPVEKYLKKDLYKIIPEELAELSWSCRTPIYINGIPRKCGNCKVCKLPS